MTHFILRLVSFLLYVNFSVDGINKISHFPQGNSIRNTQSLKKNSLDNLPLEDGGYLDPSLDNSTTRNQEVSQFRPKNQTSSDENEYYSVPESLLLEENRSPNTEVMTKTPLSPEDDNPVVEGETSSNHSVNYLILNNLEHLNSQQRKQWSSKTKRSNPSKENSLRGEETPLNSTMSTNILAIESALNPPEGESDPRDDQLSKFSQRNFVLEENSPISFKGSIAHHRIQNSSKNDLVHGLISGNSELQNTKITTLPQSDSLTGKEDPSSVLPSDLFAVNNHSTSIHLVNPILQSLKSPSDRENYNPKEQDLENSEQVQAEGKSHNARLPKVFFLISTTTTKTTLTTVTRTVLNTCYSTHMSTTAPSDFNLGPCNGRKRRKRFLNTFPTDAKESENETETALDSTLSDSLEENGEAGNRKQRLLTFWSTSRTTITVTTKSFITGTTATVTVQCTLANVITSPFCGFIHFD